MIFLPQTPLENHFTLPEVVYACADIFLWILFPEFGKIEDF